MAAATEGATKRRIFEVLEVNALGDPFAKAANVVLVVLILVNLVSVVLETVPDLARRYGMLFWAVEFATVMVFAAEYALRLWVADLHPPLARRGALLSRLSYVVQPASLVDLAAIVPGVIGLFVGFTDASVLVVFRLLRFLKLARYSPGMRSLINAVVSERRALSASAVVMAGLIVSSAAVMHAVEGRVQPERFGSIPAAMYWSVTTMTTVGYGDLVPVTPAGKLVAGIVMLFGFCMFALPVGIIATAFAREVHQRDFVVTWGMVARVPLFAELVAADIAEVTRLLRAQTVEAGTVVAYAGEPAHTMYFIATGTVELDLPDRKVRLGEGDFFGEIAVLRKTTRTADVVALTTCRLLLLDADDLHHLMARRPALARHIRNVARERVDGEALSPKGDLVTEELP